MKISFKQVLLTLANINSACLVWCATHEMGLTETLVPPHETGMGLGMRCLFDSLLDDGHG